MLASAVLVALAVPVPTSVDPVNIQRDVAMVTEPTKKGPVAIGQIQGNANTLSCDGALTSRASPPVPRYCLARTSGVVAEDRFIADTPLV